MPKAKQNGKRVQPDDAGIRKLKLYFGRKNMFVQAYSLEEAKETMQHGRKGASICGAKELPDDRRVPWSKVIRAKAK